MQAAEDDLRAALAIPTGQRVGSLGEGQVDRDADDLRERLARRRPLQQVLVPVARPPTAAACWRRCSSAPGWASGRACRSWRAGPWGKTG